MVKMYLNKKKVLYQVNDGLFLIQKVNSNRFKIKTYGPRNISKKWELINELKIEEWYTLWEKLYNQERVKTNYDFYSLINPMTIDEIRRRLEE